MAPQATAFTGKESEFKSVHIFDLQLETESVFRHVYQVLQNIPHLSSVSVKCQFVFRSLMNASVFVVVYISVQEKWCVFVCVLVCVRGVHCPER